MSDLFDDIEMTEEEMLENRVGFVRGPEIVFSGKDGNYKHSETEQQSPVVEGIVLGVIENRLMYGGDNTPFPGIDTWICRNDYCGKASPRYNEQLDDDTLRQAMTLGGEGFGLDCRRCAFRQFTKNDKGEDVKPVCGGRQALLFLDDRYPDTPLPLHVKGMSLPPMWAFLKGKDFKTSKGAQQPYMVRRVRFSSAKDGKGTRQYFYMVFEPLEHLTERQRFNELREQGLTLLQSYAKLALSAPKAGPLPALVAPQQSSAATWSASADSINEAFASAAYEDGDAF